jgi:predicted DNA-binding protein with PD1-like motif
MQPRISPCHASAFIERLLHPTNSRRRLPRFSEDSEGRGLVVSAVTPQRKKHWRQEIASDGATRCWVMSLIQTETPPMDAKLIHQNDGQRTFALILKTGEAVFATLMDFAKSNRISAAQITGIGALSDVELKYFDWNKKEYLNIPVKEQVEVASLLGDIALSPTGDPAVHVHIVVGRRDGGALAGHLGEAHVRPTLEVILTESPAHLQKVQDPESGLALIHAEGCRVSSAATK